MKPADPLPEKPHTHIFSLTYRDIKALNAVNTLNFKAVSKDEAIRMGHKFCELEPQRRFINVKPFLYPMEAVLRYNTENIENLDAKED